MSFAILQIGHVRHMMILLLCSSVKVFIGCSLEEDSKKVKLTKYMSLYLQQLFQDAQETNWYTTKSAHQILLLEMERGKLYWKDNNKVHQILARYIQRPHTSLSD